MLQLPPAAEEGIRLFNARYYFEAHDLLEEVWIERTGSERRFYQGLIQVAVGLYKVALGNQGGAVSLLRKGLTKLKEVRALDTPIDLERLIGETESTLARVERLGQSRIGEFDPEEAPLIHPRPAAAGVARRVQARGRPDRDPNDPEPGPPAT